MTEAPHRRVLMLAYLFPPLGGGGVQRTLKHVKYLPDEGFDPSCSRRSLAGHRHVTRRWARRSLLRHRDPGSGASASAYQVGTGRSAAPRRPLIAPDGVCRLARRDGRLGARCDVARPAGRSAIRPDVLYSTLSPASAHLVALMVSRATGIPWVADFRDAWTRNPQGEPLPGPLPGFQPGSSARSSDAPTTWSWSTRAWSCSGSIRTTRDSS